MKYNPPKLLENQKELLELIHDSSEHFALLEVAYHPHVYRLAMNKIIKTIVQAKIIQSELSRIYRENDKRTQKNRK